jgi:hypothetical protein
MAPLNPVDVAIGLAFAMGIVHAAAMTTSA